MIEAGWSACASVHGRDGTVLDCVARCSEIIQCTPPLLAVSRTGDTGGHVARGSSVSSMGDVILTATDATTIAAVAGAVIAEIAVGSADNVGVGLGISLSINEITNVTRAAIDDSDVAAGGDKLIEGVDRPAGFLDDHL